MVFSRVLVVGYMYIAVSSVIALLGCNGTENSTKLASNNDASSVVYNDSLLHVDFQNYFQSNTIVSVTKNDTLDVRVSNSQRVKSSKASLGANWKGAEAIASVAATIAEPSLRVHQLEAIVITIDDSESFSYSVSTLKRVKLGLEILNVFFKEVNKRNFTKCLDMLDNNTFTQDTKKALYGKMPKIFPDNIKGLPMLLGFEINQSAIDIYVNVEYDRGIQTYAFQVNPESSKITALSVY